MTELEILKEKYENDEITKAQFEEELASDIRMGDVEFEEEEQESKMLALTNKYLRFTIFAIVGLFLLFTIFITKGKMLIVLLPIAVVLYIAYTLATELS